MTTGSINIEMNYDETIVANNINGNYINITTGNIKLDYPYLYISKDVVHYYDNPTQISYDKNAINIEVYDYVRTNVGIFNKETKDFEIIHLNLININE